MLENKEKKKKKQMVRTEDSTHKNEKKNEI